MPCKKYYRSVLPIELLDIVGDLAGDNIYKLKFTFSKKRGFLSTIRLKGRYSDLYYPRGNQLRAETWKPVRLGNINTICNMLRLITNELSVYHIPVFRDSLQRLHRLLAEVHDYTLS